MPTPPKPPFRGPNTSLTIRLPATIDRRLRDLARMAGLTPNGVISAIAWFWIHQELDGKPEAYFRKFLSLIDELDNSNASVRVGLEVDEETHEMLVRAAKSRGLTIASALTVLVHDFHHRFSQSPDAVVRICALAMEWRERCPVFPASQPVPCDAPLDKVLASARSVVETPAERPLKLFHRFFSEKTCLRCGHQSSRLSLRYLIPPELGGTREIVNMGLFCQLCAPLITGRDCISTALRFPDLLRRRDAALAWATHYTPKSAWEERWDTPRRRIFVAVVPDHGTYLVASIHCGWGADYFQLKQWATRSRGQALPQGREPGLSVFRLPESLNECSVSKTMIDQGHAWPICLTPQNWTPKAWGWSVPRQVQSADLPIGIINRSFRGRASNRTG